MAAAGRHRFIASAGAKNSEHKALDRFHCLRLHPDGSGARVSSPEELHPEALGEPDVNLSVHPAPIS
jgi:hypothetical protein